MKDEQVCQESVQGCEGNYPRRRSVAVAAIEPVRVNAKSEMMAKVSTKMIMLSPLRHANKGT